MTCIDADLASVLPAYLLFGFGIFSCALKSLLMTANKSLEPSALRGRPAVAFYRLRAGSIPEL